MSTILETKLAAKTIRKRYSHKILALEEKRKKEIRFLFEKRGIVAISLDELSELRMDDFTEVNDGPIRKARSKHDKESAYYCAHCMLWIVGKPQTLTSDSKIFVCEICGKKGGAV